MSLRNYHGVLSLAYGHLRLGYWTYSRFGTTERILRELETGSKCRNQINIEEQDPVEKRLGSVIDANFNWKSDINKVGNKPQERAN